MTQLSILMGPLLLALASVQQIILADLSTTPTPEPTAIAFQLTYSPQQVTRGITTNVTLTCEHNDVTVPTFSEISYIRIMRETGSGWEIFSQKTLANDSTYFSDPNLRSWGNIASNVKDTYLSIEWAVASADTFGTYRCDIIGLDVNLWSVTETTPELVLQETPVTTEELLDLLLEARAELAALTKSMEDDRHNLDTLREDSLMKEEVASWPGGDFALLQPKDGCPVDLTFMGGSESFFTLHTESSDGGSNENKYSDAMPLSTTTVLDGTVNLLTLRFCESKRSFNTYNWPAGSYCINKIPDKPCPASFDEGYIFLDAEDNNTTTDLRGNVVTKFGDRVTLEFCCMDGYSSFTMTFPSHSPFLLYKRGGSCQAVRDMNVSDEFVNIDTEDTNNGDRVSGEIPDITSSNTSGEAILLPLCYYTPA